MIIILIIRRFKISDADNVAALIKKTVIISNSKDYSEVQIKEHINSHSSETLKKEYTEDHMYVVCDGEKTVACGGITGYLGSKTESYLKTIFVLPEYQSQGIGKMIIKTLENDEFFTRAWRTEVASSITAHQFYFHMGYRYKNGVTTPDQYGAIRMEKIK